MNKYANLYRNGLTKAANNYGTPLGQNNFAANLYNKGNEAINYGLNTSGSAIKNLASRGLEAVKYSGEANNASLGRGINAARQGVAAMPGAARAAAATVKDVAGRANDSMIGAARSANNRFVAGARDIYQNSPLAQGSRALGGMSVTAPQQMASIYGGLKGMGSSLYGRLSNAASSAADAYGQGYRSAASSLTKTGPLPGNNVPAPANRNDLVVSESSAR